MSGAAPADGGGRESPDSATATDLPDEGAPLPPHLDQLVQGTRSAEELAASLTGRWPRPRLLHQYELPRVDEPELTLLETTGPFLGRSLELVDPDSPVSVVVATSIELVVLDRLPPEIADDLRKRQESLDRLLDEHDVDWDSQLIRAVAVQAPAPAVQVLRRIWLDCLIGALVSEEHLLTGDQAAAPGSQEPVT